MTPKLIILFLVFIAVTAMPKTLYSQSFGDFDYQNVVYDDPSEYAGYFDPPPISRENGFDDELLRQEPPTGNNLFY
uniref:Uncharacterized protein n=1 Tax=Panagrellus redivivus TaxID=6233 RepID=A0A7E4W516_PANRE